ncbi:hypothetical protein ABVV53_02810 [Novosphingobium sp. RD2P27]|uniref:Peptidyl-prolyl cis-trans isomerase, EpsD family n=1 Tax=Novosphingobium kalidii TaxID=3230299 RepID=A0ABV2CXT8_9SPHN
MRLLRSGAGAARLLLAFGMLVTIAACGEKTPNGQVVAVVDGEEVTRRELAFEPEAGTSGEGTAQPALAALLSGVIDRKLAVAEARRLDLDQTPEYLARAKRLDEVMLSRTLFDRWAEDAPEPSEGAVASFISTNPQRFEGRKLFLVDRIQAASTSPAEALKPLQSNDAVASYLDSHSQPYGRERTVLDSATLPFDLYQQIVALPAETPLVLAHNGALVSLAVLQAKDAPPAPVDRTAMAITALKQEAVQEKLLALRKDAEISYQPGYAPTTTPSAELAAKRN